MNRCEDFPCCGHYETETGEIFCHEYNRSPEERRRDEAIAQAELEYQEAMEAKERRERWAYAPEDHDEEACEENPCKDCIVEADDAANQDRYDREHYYLDPQW